MKITCRVSPITETDLLLEVGQSAFRHMLLGKGVKSLMRAMASKGKAVWQRDGLLKAMSVEKRVEDDKELAGTEQALEDSVPSKRSLSYLGRIDESTLGLLAEALREELKLQPCRVICTSTESQTGESWDIKSPTGESRDIESPTGDSWDIVMDIDPAVPFGRDAIGWPHYGERVGDRSPLLQDAIDRLAIVNRSRGRFSVTASEITESVSTEPEVTEPPATASASVTRKSARGEIAIYHCEEDTDATLAEPYATLPNPDHRLWVKDPKTNRWLLIDLSPLSEGPNAREPETTVELEPNVLADAIREHLVYTGVYEALKQGVWLPAEVFRQSITVRAEATADFVARGEVNLAALCILADGSARLGRHAWKFTVSFSASLFISKLGLNLCSITAPAQESTNATHEGSGGERITIEKVVGVASAVVQNFLVKGLVGHTGSPDEMSAVAEAVLKTIIDTLKLLQVERLDDMAKQILELLDQKAPNHVRGSAVSRTLSNISKQEVYKALKEFADIKLLRSDPAPVANVGGVAAAHFRSQKWSFGLTLHGDATD